MLDRRLTRSLKEVLHGYAAGPFQIRDLNLCVQGKKGNCAVGGRKRVRHIPAQGCHISHLGSADEHTGFGQRLPMPGDFPVLRNVANRNGGADEQPVPANIEGREFFDGG